MYAGPCKPIEPQGIRNGLDSRRLLGKGKDYMIERCTLCGGRLSKGRCTECGLDNTKNDKKYHLNLHNEKEEQLHQGTCEENLNKKRQNRTEKEKKEKESTPGQRQWYMGWRQPGIGEPKKKQKKKKTLSRRAVKWIVLLIILLGFVFPLLSSIVLLIQEKVEEETYVDPYMLQEGAAEEETEYPVVWDGSGSMMLKPGFYQAGYELPEGMYRIESQEADTVFSYRRSQKDSTQNVSLYSASYIESLDKEEAEGLQSEYEDLILEEGGWLFIEDITGVSVLYGVDVSDTELKEHESQGLTEEIEVQPGETLEAGQDFPAGVYDLVIRGEDSEDFLFAGIMVEFGENDSKDSHLLFLWSDAPRICRLPLVEGSLVDGSYFEGEEGQVFLSPSY